MKRLSIIGTGLLGTSIGLAVKQGVSGWHVIGYNVRGDRALRAVERGAIDEAQATIAGAVGNVDLVIVCTPVGQFETVLTEIGHHVPAGAVVTDVGSTKRSVVKLAARVLPAGVHFVGSHPMAGSEKRGVDAGQPDLFVGRVCIVTPEASTNALAVTMVEDFWKSLQMKVRRLTPERHDRVVARISHLPQALAMALVAMQNGDDTSFAGKGFLDTTRIAGSDGAMWRDIMLDNRDELLAAMNDLRTQLSTLEGLLKAGDGNPLLEWLDAAGETRRTLNPPT